MTEIDTPAARLWTVDGFQEDVWTRTDSVQALAGDHGIILPLSAYLALDEQTRAMNKERIGVHVAPGEGTEALAPYLSDLPLISLGFPAFSDGRSYSKAALLRRAGFAGALRASGDVLIDQIPLMIRTGFSEFEVTNQTALHRLQDGRVGGTAYRYQPSVATEAQGAHYSWRRHEAG